VFFLILILCVTRLFVINTKVNTILGILAISHKNYINTVY
jgi:hypothetical protein